MKSKNQKERERKVKLKIGPHCLLLLSRYAINMKNVHSFINKGNKIRQKSIQFDSKSNPIEFKSDSILLGILQVISVSFDLLLS